jgi:predicted acylesterase/phospholipase RssA
MIEIVELPSSRQRPLLNPLGADVLNTAAQVIQKAFDELRSQDEILSEILTKILSKDAKIVVFGGWARDRLLEHLMKRKISSRDIDFVVDSAIPIAEFFPNGALENPFGGVGIRSPVTQLDAWNLDKTFLLKGHKAQTKFSELLATADYNINALLFFPSQFHGKASLLDGGAGHALMSSHLDFMADKVAQPKIQAARAVILAAKLEMRPSETVCDFVQDVCEEGGATKEIEAAIDSYCPSEFSAHAHQLLAQIRQGSNGGRPKTELFFHCWGVFEGGGVRAAAHAGAYAAAKRAGVTFGRVAGTSGGSIVAALVAAGAHPAYLRRHLLQLDLLPLLGKPSQSGSVFKNKPPFWARLLRPLTWGRLRKLANVAMYGGLYGSEPLGDWIEGRLVELVRGENPTNKRPVIFSDLPIPLYVVAIDFSTGQPKVWSNETTGEDSVALAIRHSCTIPFIFQPAKSEGSIFLDGGAVSNLPAYVLNKQNGTTGERDVLSRILAFRLVEDDPGRKPVSDLLDFGRRLSQAVIDSASEIQLQLQPNVYPIQINTGSIQSLGFDTINAGEKRFLYERGLKAAREFIQKEALVALRGDATKQEFHGFDEKMLLLVRQIPLCKQTFLAMGEDIYWLDHVFPSLLLLLRRGVRVTAVVSSTKRDQQEARRRELLRLLGANVTETSELLPFTGFVFDSGTKSASAIVSSLPDTAQAESRYEKESVRFYTADSDPVVLNILTKELSAHTNSAAPSVWPLTLEYAPCTPQKLIDRLRQVPAYREASIQIQSITVTDKILVMQRRIKEFKALQIRSFMSDLVGARRPFFVPTEVQLANGKSSIVTPPVLERKSGSLVIIDGNTRLHHCFTNGINEVVAIVIENVTDPLPSDGHSSLSTLRIVSSTIPIALNYPNYEESRYRHIERAVHETYE